MDKAAERRARRAAAARARRSDPAVRAREAEASRDSARRRREDPAVRALTLLTSFIEHSVLPRRSDNPASHFLRNLGPTGRVRHHATSKDETRLHVEHPRC
ncbi:hypothetical protein HPB50_023216 [Hyalomma asiaticum]|uniref:Uncharacterized protein n=1 Tax=Hyalomma asiaticum TaxID=266040 RepID=A0ACB7SQD4_HYAAI|nr:hypothetical protein HPB50_023216 [Hyalomma asiaticum]